MRCFEISICRGTSPSDRTLETTAESILAADDTASGFLKTVLSSIPPPVPLGIVILYQDYDLDCQFC